MKALDQFTDADFRRTVVGALRMLAILTAVGATLLWLKLGWQSAVLLLVGSVISGSGLWEWLRLATAVMAQMDTEAEHPDSTVKVRPMGRVLLGFLVRLGLTVALLYVSLKLLNGSVYALAAGLGLGVFCLSVEGLRLIKAWTV
jgi:hypothetical protein